MEVGLNAGDAGGAQADFFERFLRKHSDNIKDDTITSVKRGYIFTRRLHGSRKCHKRKPHNLLTSREKRTLGLFTVTRHGQLSYNSFLRIHDLWKGYFKVSLERCNQSLKSQYFGSLRSLLEPLRNYIDLDRSRKPLLGRKFPSLRTSRYR